jgi:acetyl esterase/lipase
MPVNTITVATAVTPTVIETCISHYLNRRPLRQKPTAHISYHEGLELIRRFLYYASFHTVEDLQAFTSQWVPVPRWVHVEEVEISGDTLSRSAAFIQEQLGPQGIKEVGGKTWWQWRLDNAALKAEWIEMRKDYEERTKLGAQQSQRIMLYVHGGAYYFGSVDEHRYQMQRHARKLKARVLAPRYRLAPQFPFPCGLQDCECSRQPKRDP